MLRGELEEQGIGGGKGLRVDEADGHEEHERGEIDQEPKAVGSIHVTLPEACVCSVAFADSSYLMRFIHKQDRVNRTQVVGQSFSVVAQFGLALILGQPGELLLAEVLLIFFEHSWVTRLRR